MPAKTTDGPKRRNATNACAACKRAKLRCKLPDPNSTERACDRCKTRNTPCVFSAEPDLRAARSSLKAHVESLQARVDQLEAQLAAAGLPPAVAASSSTALQAELPSPPSPQDSIVPLEDDEEEMEALHGQEQSVRRDREKQPLQDEQAPLVSHTLDHNGGVASAKSDSFLPFPLSSDLHASLLDSAFKHFLNPERLVGREHFFADLNKDRSSMFYSPFLHLAILAIGCRYVHEALPDLASNPSEPSTRGEPFVNAALERLNAELADPRYSTIQGLMVLSRWMGGAKQLQRGWIYAGMATRLCIDLGLHLDPSSVSDEAQEPSVRELRQKLFWSCAANESFWSALLGRPSDSIIAQSRQPDLPLDGTTWPCLCRLHRIAFKVYELSFGEPAFSRTGGGIGEERNRVEKVKQVGEDLENWYGTIPAALRWETSSTSDPDMFNLNLIYRQTLLFLYKPFLLDAPAPSSNSLAAPTTSHSLIALLSHARKVLTGLCVESARLGEKYHVEVGSRWLPDGVLPASFHAGAVSFQLSLLPPLPDSPTFKDLPVREALLDAYSRCITVLDEMGHSCSMASAAAAKLREMKENPATGKTAASAPSVPALAGGRFSGSANAATTAAAATGAGAVSAGQPVAPFPTASTSAPAFQQPSLSSAAHFVPSLNFNPFHKDLRSRQSVPPSSSSASVNTAFFPPPLASTASSPFPPIQQQQRPDTKLVSYAGSGPSRDGPDSTGVAGDLAAKPTRPL